MPYKDPEKQKEAQRRSYEKNKSKSEEAGRERRRKKYAEIQKIKEASPCTDCDKFYPYYVMQFDHIGSDKVANVGKLVRAAGWKTVLEEIAKCELVCANCHAERSWKRLNNMHL